MGVPGVAQGGIMDVPGGVQGRLWEALGPKKASKTSPFRNQSGLKNKLENMSRKLCQKVLKMSLKRLPKRAKSQQNIVLNQKTVICGFSLLLQMIRPTFEEEVEDKTVNKGLKLYRNLRT